MRRRNPISKQTRSRAQALRQDSTDPERRLWRCLRNRRLAGLKFLRQAPLEPYIVDFLCRERQLVVEIDGDSHADRYRYDAARERMIESQGFRFLRVSNDDVWQNIEGVLTAIVTAAGIDVDQWRSGNLGQIDAE